MIFLRCRSKQALDTLLRDDTLGGESDEYTFTEPEFHFRLIFRLGHSDTSFREDSISPDLRQSTPGVESYQKVIIYEVPTRGLLVWKSMFAEKLNVAEESRLKKFTFL